MIQKSLKEELESQSVLGLLMLKNESKDTELSNRKLSVIQIDVLKAISKITLYPAAQTKCNLCILLKLKQNAINNWFAKERILEKMRCGRDEIYEMRMSRITIPAFIVLRIYKKVVSYLHRSTKNQSI